MILFILVGNIILHCVAGLTCMRTVPAELNMYILVGALELVFNGYGIKVWMSRTREEDEDS